MSFSTTVGGFTDLSVCTQWGRRRDQIIVNTANRRGTALILWSRNNRLWGGTWTVSRDTYITREDPPLTCTTTG